MSLQRNRRADRVDRTVLTLSGLVVTGAGVAALAAGAGAFGDGTADRPVLGPGLRDALDTNGGLIGLAAILGLLLLAGLAVLWLVRLLRPAPQADELTLRATPRRSDDMPAGNVPDGTTTLAPSALTDAVTRQLCSLREVVDATVRIPDRHPVEVHALVTVVDDTDTQALMRAVLDDVRAPVLRVTGLDDVRFLIELRPTDQRASRVA
jgi:hypothetical protein